MAAEGEESRMREKIARGIALLAAVLLTLGYFLLPAENEVSTINNSGRKKLELESGERYSWPWTPGSGTVTRVDVRLTGMKKAQDVTVYAQIETESGEIAASAVQPIAELGEDGDSIRLEGTFSGGTAYILTLWAEGDGAIKVKGEEDDETETFYPMLSEGASSREFNPVMLYFAAGALLAALTPVYGKAGSRVESSTAGGNGRKEQKTSRSRLEAVLPWIAFAIVGGVGMLIVLMKPFPELTPGGAWAGWDEETHWMRVQSMDLTRSGGLRALAGELITWNPGYAPLAVGYNLGRIFSLSDDLAYHLAAACSVLVYAAMCAMAVKHAPRFKATFLAAGTLPTFFYLMTCMTYDTVVAGSLLLGTALVLESVERETPMTSFRVVTMVSLLAFGTVAKPAYSLALLALLMIPAARFDSRGKAWIFRIFVILMLVWCLIALVMPGAYDNVREGDSRLADANPREQIASMLASPVQNGLYPLRHMWDFQRYLAKDGISDWYTVGNNGTLNSIYLWLLLILAPLCTIGEKNQSTGRKLLPPGRRLAFGGISIGIGIMFAYAQYLFSSPVGGGMQGLQARYFMPIWIFTALALMWPAKIRQRLGRIGPWLFLPIALICLGVNLWNALGYLMM